MVAMQLYTYQTIEAVKRLHEEGVLRLSEAERRFTYLGQYDGQNHNPFDAPYRFMMLRMRQRLPEPEGDAVYPIWAWYKSNGRYKPSKALDKIHEGKIRLKLEVDPKRVLLSDFDRFAYLTVGGLYFVLSPEDEETYGKNIFAPEPTFYPNWDHIFEIHRPKDDDYGSSYRSETIQGTLFELFREDVVEEVTV